MIALRLGTLPSRHDNEVTLMLDWLQYRKELLGRIGEIGKLSRDTLKGCQTLSVPARSVLARGPAIWTRRPAS